MSLRDLSKAGDTHADYGRVPAISRSSDSARPAENADPGRLVALLSGCGWETVGRREGAYVRLRGSEEAYAGMGDASVIVPLNRAAGDFDLLMQAAVDTVSSSSPEVWKRSIEPFLELAAVDAFVFRKETSAPRGLIAWKDGSALIDSARRTLIAGAKAHREPSRCFSNRHGQFAGRYLDQVFMGQSGVGSYIVTAFAPIEADVPIRRPSEGTLGLEGVDAARSRDVTRSVVRALEAAVGAIDHYKRSGSMAGFSERVDQGVSSELVIALRDIASGADQSDIKIELAPTSRTPSAELEPAPEIHCFEFSGGDTGVLERAASQLSAPDEIERTVVEGRVHLLTKQEAGGPGVFGVDDGRHRYRVRLSDGDQYHEAVIAHDEDRYVIVEGELSREGSFRWLYGARMRIPPASGGPGTPLPLAAAPMRGQMQLDTTDIHHKPNP